MGSRWLTLLSTFFLILKGFQTWGQAIGKPLIGQFSVPAVIKPIGNEPAPCFPPSLPCPPSLPYSSGFNNFPSGLRGIPFPPPMPQIIFTDDGYSNGGGDWLSLIVLLYALRNNGLGRGNGGCGGYGGCGGCDGGCGGSCGSCGSSCGCGSYGCGGGCNGGCNDGYNSGFNGGCGGSGGHVIPIDITTTTSSSPWPLSSSPSVTSSSSSSSSSSGASSGGSASSSGGSSTTITIGSSSSDPSSSGSSCGCSGSSDVVASSSQSPAIVAYPGRDSNEICLLIKADSPPCY